jgi:hypothetical protein
LAGKPDVIQGTEASPVITAQAYKVNINRQDTPSKHNAAESYSNSTIESDEDTPCDASSKLDSAESRRKLSGKKCQRHHPEKTTSRTGRWRQGGVQPTKSREDGFEPPKETEEVRTKADRMMNEALNQVPDAVHFNPKSKRSMVTLYAGNLDFKADGVDILESLRKSFRHRIQVNEIAVPNYHGRSMGYAFVTLSWVREAEDLDPADICKFYSGVIQVKSRCLYFEELHDDVADKEHEKAYAAQSDIPQETAGGFYFCISSHGPCSKDS